MALFIKRLSALMALCMVGVSPALAADLLAVYQRALQNDPQLREAEATRLWRPSPKPCRRCCRSFREAAS
jgi:hypothetical protein